MVSNGINKTIEVDNQLTQIHLEKNSHYNGVYAWIACMHADVHGACHNSGTDRLA